MTRLGAHGLTSAVLLVCGVAACHPGGPPVPTPPTPKSTTHEDSVADDTGSSEPAEVSAEVPAEVPTEVPDTSDVRPCERSCAELYTCVIEEGKSGPAAAASIELGCLDACIQSPAPGSLFGCELPPPASRAPARCPPFLACVREAWPDRGPAVAPPVIEHVGSGCERACWAFARCEGKDQTEDEIQGISKCVRKCSEVLDDAQERRVGECSDLPSCDELEACVLSLPGA